MNNLWKAAMLTGIATGIIIAGYDRIARIVQLSFMLKDVILVLLNFVLPYTGIVIAAKRNASMNFVRAFLFAFISLIVCWAIMFLYITINRSIIYGSKLYLDLNDLWEYLVVIGIAIPVSAIVAFIFTLASRRQGKASTTLDDPDF